MVRHVASRWGLIGLATALLLATAVVGGEPPFRDWPPLLLPEQTRLMYHDPGTLPQAPIPQTGPPPTLIEPREYRSSRPISLDEAIAIALRHSEVIRVLGGVGASTSGRTIYDAAIQNTTIDEARAAFDPRLSVNNTFSQDETPAAAPFADDAVIGGTKTDNLNTAIELSQQNLTGGIANYRFGNDSSRGLFTLNPRNRFFNEISYTQPLLAGHGVAANRVPIVLAQINTERSFFQTSGAVQQLISGVIDAYWGVVFARTNVWAREIQVEQAEEAFDRAEARKRFELANQTEVALARSSLAQFRAQLLTAKGNLLQREAALQNILGIPPTSDEQLIPTTPPLEEQVVFDWTETLAIAEARRPDLIELKLVLEADRQRLIRQSNLARPELNAVSSYRWDGLSGTAPNGNRRSTDSNQFTDWTLGVNFSVPLFLRAERAGVRSAELIIARDRANLQQGRHNASHILAFNLRTLDQAWLQYEAFREAREAARLSLEAQYAAYRNEQEQVLFINVLQAISDFGNAVSQEADALLRYNTTLANLERETGTILETHGVFLAEDLRCSVGPCWITHEPRRAYSAAHRPTPNVPRYVDGDEAAENFFDLDDAPQRGRGERTTPPPEEVPDDADMNAERERLGLPPLPGTIEDSDDEDGRLEEASSAKAKQSRLTQWRSRLPWRR